MSNFAPFIYILHCTVCGIHGEIDEYTQTFVCPTCGGEMRLSEIRLVENSANVETALDQLVIARENGDISAGKQLAFLADNSDRNIREMVENAFYKRQCQKRGVIFRPLQASVEPVFSDNNDPGEVIEPDDTDFSKIQTYINADDSDLLKKALAIIISEQKAGTAFLQRRLRIGYNQAAEIIDELEKRGIVGSYVTGTSQRKVLVPVKPTQHNIGTLVRHIDSLSSTINPDTSTQNTVQLSAIKNRSHSCSHTHCIECGISLSFDHDLSGQQVLCPSCKRTQILPGGKTILYKSDASEKISTKESGHWVRKTKTGPTSKHPAEIVQYIESANCYRNAKIFLSITGICCGCLFAGYGMWTNHSHAGSEIGIVWTLIAVFVSLIVGKLLRFDLYRNGLKPRLFYNPKGNFYHIHQPLIQILRTGTQVKVVDDAGSSKTCSVSEKKPSDMKQNNVEAVFRLSHGIQLVIFSDLILLKSNGQIRFLGTKEVTISISEKLFCTSKVTNYVYRWLHQRKDGGPDRRYNYNPQQAIPAEYGLNANSTYVVHLILDGYSFICEVNDTPAAQRIIDIWNKKTA